MSVIQENNNDKKLSALIEALLFNSSSLVSISQLTRALKATEKEIHDALDELQSYYNESRYLALQWHGKKVQLVTSADISGIVEDFLGLEVKTTLSQAALETLAIIAYKQPISRPQVDEIRGVNSDGVIRNLLSKGLIEEVGRDEGIGRAILYGTTAEFLNYFGLTSLDQLPAFDILPITENEGRKILKD